MPAMGELVPTSFGKTLRQLRNTRDLRAEILGLAASLVANRARGRLVVADSVINQDTVQAEWDRLLPALAPDVRDRMSLVVQPGAASTAKASGAIRVESGVALLDRPNYRYEVLRLLLESSLEGDGPQSIRGLVDAIGASQTPVRQALAELKRSGIAHSWGRGVAVSAEDVSLELMTKLRAAPQTLRFRFERGSQIKPPAALLARAMPLLGPGGGTEWRMLSLSGVPVAGADVPGLDLMGLPRLDLVAHASREAKSFDTRLLRLLDDGLELEPNILAPAPVVITVVRAEKKLAREAGGGQARCAMACDVFLSLLDLGLREQAIQYARAVRR